MASFRVGQHRFGRVRRTLLAGAFASAVVAAGPIASPASAAGAIIISEVAPWGSGNASYAVDWFEVTNTGASGVNIAGWKVDDNSNSFAASVALNGVTSIAAGESVIFMESSTPATTIPLFTSAWFGSDLPVGLQVGTYSGAGMGLGTGGDAVNLFNSSGALQAKVTFGASPAAAPFATFDNAAGLDNATISTLSVVGTNGASLVASTPPAIGSPGTIVNSSTPPTTTTTVAGPTTTTTIAPSTALPWPGDATVQDRSTYVFGGNLSGLIEEPSGTASPDLLWAVRNGPGALFRLLWDGTKWAPDTANNWGAGKALRYPGGTGDADAEGVTYAGSPAAGIFVATERNNLANTVSRPAILRFDPNAAGATLDATMEWNLTADLPAVGANLGLEAITWVPDSYLVANNFKTDANVAYNPATYANHAGGLFFVGLEGTGGIYAYALDQVSGGFTRVTTIANPFVSIMELQFDRDLNEMWAVCDNTCNGQHAVMRIDPATGTFSVAKFDRPTGMPNYNNEGFAIASAAQCINDRKPVYWANDGEDLGVSIRGGNIPCASGPVPIVPEFPFAVLALVLGFGVLGTVLLVNRRRVPLA
jgi:Lamin Tail Domain